MRLIKSRSRMNYAQLGIKSSTLEKLWRPVIYKDRTVIPSLTFMVRSDGCSQSTSTRLGYKETFLEINHATLSWCPVTWGLEQSLQVFKLEIILLCHFWPFMLGFDSAWKWGRAYWYVNCVRASFIIITPWFTVETNPLSLCLCLWGIQVSPVERGA